MSVLPRNRAWLGAILFLTTQALFAAYPSARTEVRMAHDPMTGNLVLFGGQTDRDSATQTSYDLAETWLWLGERWVQHYPSVTPPARSGHAMVTDTNRAQIVMFGGRQGATELNDTWVWKFDNWREVVTPNAPTKRIRPAMAFDPLRDRVVLVGGEVRSADGRIFTAVHDTWEFDGTTWTRSVETGPTVLRPLLVYDGGANRMMLLGLNEKAETLMYYWNNETKAWDRQTPAALPPCVNQSNAVYQQHNNRVVVHGGVCQNSGITDETWEWDGTTWAKRDTTNTEPARVFGQATAYDPSRSSTVEFGGTVAFSSARDDTYIYKENKWAVAGIVNRPAPRSLAGISSDPDADSVWLLGGLVNEGYAPDFWRYQAGQWTRITNDKTPSACVAPLMSYDSDRKVTVLFCGGTEGKMHEWKWAANAEGVFAGEWRVVEGLKGFPDARRLASMVYDPQLKKTVLFGGFDETRYRDDTWLWDGTTWTEIKKNRPTARALTSMWFDPTQKKVMFYGGIGRPDPEDRITRYDDMWSFNGTGWTKMNVTPTPGARYGAQLAVDPRTNTAVLMGGLLLTTQTDGKQVQIYADDTWTWNGSSWTKSTTPSPAGLGRENAQFFFDPAADELVLYAGWKGYFISDTWKFASGTWSLEKEPYRRGVNLPRRRTVR
ncbi:MAG TPA: kelch repeat-containing protein [Thermoanaerobaculia bacterium]